MTPPRDEHRIEHRRAEDRRAQATFGLAFVGACLGALALIVTAVVSTTTLLNRDDVEQAVCATVSYAEEQASIARAGDPEQDPPRPPNTQGADQLERLASNMRKTGIDCPPRNAPVATATATPQKPDGPPVRAEPSMWDLVPRALVVLLGLVLIPILARVLFAPGRPAHATFLFAGVVLLVLSLIAGIVWAQANALPVLWYGAPVRVVGLALILGYAILALRANRKEKP